MANEKRLIDANAKELMNRININFGGVTRFVVKSILKDAPTVDAVEVVHGRWIEKIDIIGSYLSDCTEVFYVCSVCESGDIGKSPYCPNCGAKMDGDGNG